MGCFVCSCFFIIGACYILFWNDQRVTAGDGENFLKSLLSSFFDDKLDEYALVELSDLIADKMQNLIVLLMMAKEKLLTFPSFYLGFDLLSLL